MKKVLFLLCLTLLMFTASTFCAESEPQTMRFAGDSTDILVDVEIVTAPVRITFTQKKAVEFEVTYILAGDERELMSESKCTNGCAVLLKNGTYEFIIETDANWELMIEPLVRTNDVSFSGTGDYVTDIFNLDKSSIYMLSGKFNDFTNYIVRLYTLNSAKNTWSYDNVISELMSAGKTIETKKALKTTQPTECFLVVDFCDSEWTIAPVK